MTTTSTTPLDDALERVLRLLTTARSVCADPSLAQDVQEVELTIHEVLEVAAHTQLDSTVTTAHDALTAAEATLDAIPRDHRALWLLPFRAELAILRRRSAT